MLQLLIPGLPEFKETDYQVKRREGGSRREVRAGEAEKRKGGVWEEGRGWR